VTPLRTPLNYFCIFSIKAPVINLSVKFDANIFIATDIWLFYYFVDLAAKCIFPSISGRFFGGYVVTLAFDTGTLNVCSTSGVMNVMWSNFV